MSPKRVALWFLIISVALSAALGIVAILTGNFGEFETRVILTTVTISLASICALAAGALWESKKTRWLPTFAVTLAILAALLLIIGIWADEFVASFWKLATTTTVMAVATAQACLVSLARLAPRFSWARTAALIAISFLAFLIIVVIYGEFGGEGIVKTIGTTAIIVAALTIMMPIFHRLSRGDLSTTPKLPASDQHLFPTVLCPRCGTTQNNSPFQITCSSCGCRFIVSIIDDSSPTGSN